MASNTEAIEMYREFLKNYIWEKWADLETDQRKDAPPPPRQKPYPKDVPLIDLVSPQDLQIGEMPLSEAIKRRRSRRDFTAESLTLEELSFLLWATQGVSEMTSRRLLRTVPSGGARHPFETYLLVSRVAGLAPGLYRYLSLEHKLCVSRPYAELVEAGLIEGAWGARWDSAVAFIWTAIPYRTEWRYSILSPKIIALDAGHICQNLYLATEAIGAGMCAIGAYHQEKADALVNVDGQEEFVVYLAMVGKVAR